jgi:hypothetical protein
MSETVAWLERYEQGHQQLRYPLIFWASVPMAMLGVVGILWTLPIPDEFYEISPLLNWGSAFLMVSAVYYFIISLSLAIGMLPFLLGVAALQMWLLQSQFSPLRVSCGLLLAGVIGLWLGHRGGAGLKGVLRDLQMVMIGPAWILSAFYRKLGIPI